MITSILPIRIYYEDTDSGGVVYHANYLKYYERGRTEWLRQLGFELDELLDKDNVLFIIRTAQVEYLKPLRFNDLFKVETTLKHLGKASLHFEQQIILPKHQLMSTADMRVACVNARTLRPCAIPRHLEKELSRG